MLPTDSQMKWRNYRTALRTWMGDDAWCRWYKKAIEEKRQGFGAAAWQTLSGQNILYPKPRGLCYTVQGVK